MGFCIPKIMSNFVDLCLNISSSINLQFLTGDWRPWIYILLPKNFLMRLKGKREEDHHSTIDSISFFRSMSMSQIKSILVIFVFCYMLCFQVSREIFFVHKQTISLDPLNLFCFSTFFKVKPFFTTTVFSIWWWMTLPYWMMKY